jgi:hypothetical protein
VRDASLGRDVPDARAVVARARKDAHRRVEQLLSLSLLGLDD